MPHRLTYGVNHQELISVHALVHRVSHGVYEHCCNCMHQVTHELQQSACTKYALLHEQAFAVLHYVEYDCTAAYVHDVA